MIARLQDRRVRRRLLACGTAVVLSSATIIFTALSVIGYDRYQQLAAEARTASDTALEAEQFAREMGFLAPNGEYLPNDHFPPRFLCTGGYTPGERWEIVAVGSSESCVDMAIHTDFMAQDDGTPRLHPMRGCTMKYTTSAEENWVTILVPTGGMSCVPVPIGPFELDVSFAYSKYHLSLVDTRGHQVLADFATLLSSGDNEPFALTYWSIDDFDRVQNIDVLDKSDKVVASFQVLGTTAQFRLTARQTADETAQAAKDALKELVAVGVGALLTFFAISALGWIARGRISLRRALQRQRITGRGIWQASGEKAWTERLTMGLIASAVRALDHPDDQNRYREEWAADAEEIPSRWQRLRWALLLRLFAPMGIRSARRDELSMSPPQQQ